MSGVMGDALPYAPLTTEELFQRQDEASRRIGRAIEMGWHRKPELHALLDADAAERRNWGTAIDVRILTSTAAAS